MSAFKPAAPQPSTLAKDMRDGSGEVLEHPLKLAQAQEILARTFGYRNWQYAIKASGQALRLR